MSNQVDLVVDAPTLCNYFGVSSRQLQNYKKMGLPVQGRNQYNVRECIEWYTNWKVQSALKSNQKPIQADEEELKLRKLEAEALLKEIEVATLKGELINITDAQKELTKHLTSVRNGIMAFPARTAPFLVGLDNQRVVRDVLDREIVNLMTFLMENTEEEPIEPSPESGDEWEDDVTETEE